MPFYADLKHCSDCTSIQACAKAAAATIAAAIPPKRRRTLMG